MFIILSYACLWQCSENKELQEKVHTLEQQLASFSGDKMSHTPEHAVSEEYVDELRKKIQSQVITALSMFASS